MTNPACNNANAFIYFLFFTVMDLASDEDNQGAASSVLLNAVASGRLEDEIKRLQNPGDSSFTDSIQLIADDTIGLQAVNSERASPISIFQKAVRAFYI